MSQPVEGTAAVGEGLAVLVFTAGGMKMAVEASQISGMLEPWQAEERGLGVGALHEMFSLTHRAPAHGREKVLVINGDAPYGIIVDRLDEIAPASLDDIRPMPQLLSGAEGTGGAFWGALVKGEEVVLLVDLCGLSEIISNTGRGE